MLRFAGWAVVGVCAASAPARDFVANTFLEDWGYETQAGSTISGQNSEPGYTDTANKFTAALGGNITDIWLAMAWDFAGANQFDVNLRADDGDSPGEILHTWTLTDEAFPFDGNHYDPVHIDVVDPVHLDQGSAYWLELHATQDDSWLVWMFTKPPVFENVAQRFEAGGEWNVLRPGFTSAYAIAVPAPGVGAAGVAMIAWRRRRSKSALLKKASRQQGI